MNKVISKIKKNKFLHSFSILVSGTVMAQAIGILLSPIITRLFTPEQMGTYTIITTAISLFGPIICMKYDMAIIIAKDKKEEYSLIKASSIISIILSFFLSAMYTVFVVTEEKLLFSIFLFLSIFLILISYGINNILVAFNNKKLQYKMISSVTILKSFVSNIIILFSGIVKLGIMGLVISQIIGYLCGIKKQSKDLLHDIIEFKQINYKIMKKTVIKYRKQALYNMPSAFFTALIYSSINVFIKIKYSIETLGLYSLSYRVLGIPFSLISANISKIFFESASKELKETGNFKKTFKNVSMLLFIIVIPIMILIASLAPKLFSIVFGESWYEAGLYVRLLTPMFTIRLIVESLTTTFIVVNKQQSELLFYIALLVGEFLLYIMGFYFDINIRVVLILISCLYVIVYSYIYIYMRGLSKFNGEKNE